MLNFNFQNEGPLKVIAGPCQIESQEHAYKMASELTEITNLVKLSPKNMQ